jgi:hypothetical protein
MLAIQKYKQMHDSQFRLVRLFFTVVICNLVYIVVFTVNDTWKQLIFMYGQPLFVI